MNKATMTVGFADIGNFMSTHYEPEGLIRDLNQFYETAGDLILAHKGRIVKYIGDSILFVFDSPKQAVQAARELADLQVDGCQVYAGLATGEVYLGQVGHHQRRLEDVLGPTVTAAAGLMRKAKAAPDRVAMCDATRQGTGAS